MKDYLAPLVIYLKLIGLLREYYRHPYFKVNAHEDEFAEQADSDKKLDKPLEFQLLFPASYPSGLSEQYELEQLHDCFVLNGDIKLPRIAVEGNPDLTKRNLRTALTILALNNQQLQYWQKYMADKVNFVALVSYDGMLDYKHEVGRRT